MKKTHPPTAASARNGRCGPVRRFPEGDVSDRLVGMNELRVSLPRTAGRPRGASTRGERRHLPPQRRNRLPWVMGVLALAVIGAALVTGRGELRTLASGTWRRVRAAVGVPAAHARDYESPAGDTLADFDGDDPARLLTGSAARRVVGQHATSGGRALEVGFLQPQHSVGLKSGRTPFDLSGHRKLLVDAFNPGPPGSLLMKFRDRAGAGYTVWYALVASGASTLEFDLKGVAAHADAAQIDELYLYCEDKLGTVYLDSFRLADAGPVAEAPPAAEASAAPVQGGLIENGGFELGLVGWDSWGEWDGGRYTFGHGSGKDALVGGASLAIHCTAVGRGGVYAKPVRMPAGRYELRFAVKGEPKAGQPEPRMFYALTGDGKHSITLNQESKRFEVPRDWRRFTLPVQVREDAGAVTPYFFSVGGGTVYLDDVSLMPLDGPEPEGPAQVVNRTPRRVTVSEGRFAIDGKPFFPVGIFGGSPEDLAGTGFHFTVGELPTPERLDAYAKARVYVSPNLQGLMRAHLPQRIPAAIRPVMNHPAILMWYLCDEPDHQNWTVPPSELRLATELVHRTDPAHPTWSVVMSWADSNLYQYADSVDVLSTDIYPIGADEDKPVTEVAKKTAVLADAVGTAPGLVTLLAHPEVTPDQYTAMTYLALVHGAQGLAYFNHADARADADLWRRVLKVNRELNAMQETLVAGAVAGVEAECSDEAVHWMLSQNQGRYVLIAVNGTDRRRDGVRFRVPGIDGALRIPVAFESREVAGAAGSWTDTFEPYQRHVYQLVTDP